MGKIYSSLLMALLFINNLFATGPAASAVEKSSSIDWDAVKAGVLISITGLISVFAALATIALIISALPLLLSFLNKYIPEEVPHKKTPAKKANDNGGAVALAIAAAFHKRNRG